jgi:hypothetical protein
MPGKKQKTISKARHVTAIRPNHSLSTLWKKQKTVFQDKA